MVASPIRRDASVGLTQEQAGYAGERVAAVVPYADLHRAVIDGRTDGFAKLIVERDSREVVGAHLVGEQAVEVVQIAAAGMAVRMKVEQLAGLELAYPTFSSILGLAARQALHQLQAPDAAEEWQALGRRPLAEWERRDVMAMLEMPLVNREDRP